MMLANDDRPRTMHAEVECADRTLLPALVAGLLDRNDERRVARHAAWLQWSAEARSREAACQRLVDATRQASARHAGRERSADGATVWNSERWDRYSSGIHARRTMLRLTPLFLRACS
jgi:hypothetical protein